MRKEEKIEQYRLILENLQQMKAGVVSDATAELMLSGSLPSSAQLELKVLSGVTSSVFCALKTLGVPVEEDTERPGIVFAKIGDISYSCASRGLDALLELSKEQLSASEVWGAISSPEPEPAKASPIEEKPPVVQAKPEPKPEPAEKEQIEIEPEPVEEIKENAPEITEEEEFSEVISVEEEVPEVSREVDEPEEVKVPSIEIEPEPEEAEEVPAPSFEEETPSSSSSSLYELNEEEEFKDEEESENEEPEIEEKSTEFKALGGTVIGGGTTSTISKEDFFLDEFEKNAGDMVYSFVKLSVIHPEGGGRPQEILAMVAPLKIHKSAASNVPIVVALWNKGTTSLASSYLTQNTGRNMVQIEIAQYYFLVKGSFDDNGNFIPMITTTGPSAQAGDKISVIDQKNYGNASKRSTKNGHIKFHCNTDEGPGYIEVFPFGREEDEDGDFIAIVKNDEFATPYFVSDSLKGNSSVIVYEEENVPSQLVCKWEDGVMKASLEKRGR